MKTIHRSKASRLSAWLAVFAVTWVLSSCISMLHVEGDAKQVRACERTALLEVALIPPFVPPLPLIDAAMFKDKFKPAIPEIIALHEAESRTLADRIGAELQNGQPRQVLYGNRLYGMEAYRSLGNAVGTYPMVVSLSMRVEGMDRMYLAEGSLNFLRLDDHDDNFLRRHDQFSQGEVFDAAKLAAKRLGVDCTAVASADLRYRPGMFGVNGGVSLWLTMWYFDREGRQIAWGISESEVADAPAADPSNARASFQNVEKTTAALAKQVYHGALK